MSEYEGQQPQPQPPPEQWPQQPAQQGAADWQAQQPAQPQPTQPGEGYQQQPQYQQPAQPQPQYQQPQQPQYQQPPQPQYQQPVPGPPPSAPASPPATASGEPKANVFSDPSELAATGLIAAVLFAIVAGLFNFMAEVGPFGDFSNRLLALTQTVDVGDVALLGIATALLLLTPDPPGGMGRPMLLNVTAALSAIISAYGVIRSLVILTGNGDALGKFAGFVATLGVALAAATVAFYAAKESFLKKGTQATSA